MKNTAPRISNASADFYPTIFKSLNAGLEFIIDAFPIMYQRTLKRLTGPFSPKELELIIEVFKDVAISPTIAGSHLITYVIDGINLNKLDKKYNVSGDTIRAKLASLSTFDAMCLELWAYGFSHSNEFHHFKVGLDGYVGELIDIETELA